MAMCRMMATVSLGPAPALAYKRFRTQARMGKTSRLARSPGHNDGWGIAYFGSDGAPRLAGRSAEDAWSDPSYPEAISSLRAGSQRGVALAHVRKATSGAADRAHPYVSGRYAFCHNGGIETLGQKEATDSEGLFEAILARAERSPMEVAIRETAQWIERTSIFTSLTLLLAQEDTLWAYRRIGNHPVACAPKACPWDYYTLSFAIHDGVAYVSQETEYLGLHAAWKEVPDGGLLTVTTRGGRLSASLA